MTKKNLNNWIMYSEIQRLSFMGFSASKIARYLVMDSRTVAKYLKMSNQEYEQHLINSDERSKILSPYENFVKDKLTIYPDATTAQIHDWLKEFHKDIPKASVRSVYNFVMFVRQKYNIPVVQQTREYFPVEELAYGEQAQVDFGVYNMRIASVAAYWYSEARDSEPMIVILGQGATLLGLIFEKQVSNIKTKKIENNSDVDIDVVAGDKVTTSDVKKSSIRVKTRK